MNSASDTRRIYAYGTRNAPKNIGDKSLGEREREKERGALTAIGLGERGASFLPCGCESGRLMQINEISNALFHHWEQESYNKS